MMTRRDTPSSLGGRSGRRASPEAGQAAVLFGLMLTALLGILALAVDGGNLYLLRRQMQSGADLSALAGAQRLYDGSVADARDSARAYATGNGYSDAAVNIPPTSGDHSGEDKYIEVIISRTTPTFFAGALGFREVAVSARAVARAGRDTPPYAILALSETESPAIDFGGAGAVQIRGAGMMSNSPMNPSIRRSASGGWVHSDGPVNAVGTVVGSFDAPSVRGGVPPYPDPLAQMAAPLPITAWTTRHGTQVQPRKLQINASGGPITSRMGTENVTTCPGADEYTFCPGVYWGGIQIAGGSYRMAPGVYIMAGGGLAVTGGTLTGGTPDGRNGIFIYNTNDPRPTPPGGNYGGANGDFGPINFNTNQGVTLYSSHTPLYAGMAGNVLIFQDRNASDSGDAMGVQAVGNTNLYGTIYVPTNGIAIAGGGSSGVSHGQIIADTVEFTGGSAAGVEYDPNWAVVPPGSTLAE